MSVSRIVIIGAGQAGANAATELRRRGFAGSVVLVGEETRLPYERPPLSKEALLDPAKVRPHLYPQEHYDEQCIELRLGVRATAINANARTVTLSNGETLVYDKLLLTTGAQARRLPQLDALGDAVHTLRTVEDACGIREQIRPGTHTLLVGAGVIGLELASSLVELGATAEVIDPAPRAMARNSPEIISRFLQSVHEARGVKFHFNTGVDEARRTADGRVALRLHNGATVIGDLLIYGVGVITDSSLAESAGLHTVHGATVVDARCRTSNPDIHAAGDAVLQVLTAGQQQRLETWENANLQSTAAVCDMLGADVPAADAPWFWSDQCSLNIQFVGDMAAPRWVLRGTLEHASFMLFGLDGDGAICAAIAVNQGRDMRPAKELVARRARLPADTLADPASHLRNLAQDA